MRFRGVCWGWVDEATIHKKEGENRRGESKKKNQEYMTSSSGGHMTTVLAGEISRTKGL